MNFVSGMEGIARWGPRLEALQGLFVNSFCRANPDMQVHPIRGPLRRCFRGGLLFRRPSITNGFMKTRRRCILALVEAVP
jgi:hypothetical protein